MSSNYESKSGERYASGTGLPAIRYGDAVIVPHATERGWALPGGEITQFRAVAQDEAMRINALFKRARHQEEREYSMLKELVV